MLLKLKPMTNSAYSFFFKRTLIYSNVIVSRMASQSCEFRELRIPVPWGHVAAKDWGNEDGHPVLTFHGWLDNAGSFDPLIKLIDKSLNLRIIAVDIPGHGFSSHYPPGFLYNFMDAVTMIKRIISYLKFEKVSCIGHSLGAGLLSIFASLYPENIEKAVFLDFVKPVSIPVERGADMSRAGVDALLRFEEKAKNNKEPTYSEEEALDRLLKASTGRLTEETAKIILKRGLKPSTDANGFVFTRDYRLRIPSLASFTPEQHMSYLKRLKCELLVIMANDHPGWDEQSLINATISMYKRNCKYFEYAEVSGGHHFHLNSPESVSSTINNFFRKQL